MYDDRQRLEQAREISAAMLGAAETGRWADVTSLHEQCSPLLRNPTSWSDAERQMLTALQECHRKVQVLANGARAEIAAKLGRHRQAHRGLSTYLHSAE